MTTLHAARRLCATWLAVAVFAACAAQNGGSESRAEPAAQRVELTGTFHIIWGEQPRYFLTEDDGTSHRLELDPALAEAHGGTVALDRTRVCVSGERLGPDLSGIRVDSIGPTCGGSP